MKNFFCVTSKYFDDGTTDVTISSDRSETKPDNTVIHKKDVSTYIDWFNTTEEAASAACKCRELSKKVGR